MHLAIECSHVEITAIKCLLGYNDIGSRGFTVEMSFRKVHFQVHLRKAKEALRSSCIKTFLNLPNPYVHLHGHLVDQSGYL